MPLEDLLSSDLTTNNVRILVREIYDLNVQRDVVSLKTRSPKPAKSLEEFYDLVRRAIESYEQRANTPEENRIVFTEEEPDADILEQLQADKKRGIITFSLVKRQPGAFGQGAPFESNVKNLRPILREEIDDPENTGYRLATTGYWHDNLVRFTVWARTNKTANQLVRWFEDLMDEYSWWFKAEGVDRTIFWGRESDLVVNVDNNKWYGRPLDYFVRTETIKVFSEKKIEEIILTVATKHE